MSVASKRFDEKWNLENATFEGVMHKIQIVGIMKYMHKGEHDGSVSVALGTASCSDEHNI
jgi:hypothetical protein